VYNLNFSAFYLFLTSMTCLGYCKEGLKKVWLDSENGKKETIKMILIRLGYKSVQSTAPIPGEDECLISGDYRGTDGFDHGVFVNYFVKSRGERAEISSSDENRSREIEKEIRKILTQLDCSLHNLSSS
jgi:hypothetical protein